MANHASIHIQNRAPGPPVATAVATPLILPTPTAPPTAVDATSRMLIWPPLPSLETERVSLLSILPKVSLKKWVKWRNWKPPEAMVNQRLEPKTAISIGVPQIQ